MAREPLCSISQRRSLLVGLELDEVVAAAERAELQRASPLQSSRDARADERRSARAAARLPACDGWRTSGIDAVEAGEHRGRSAFVVESAASPSKAGPPCRSPGRLRPRSDRASGWSPRRCRRTRRPKGERRASPRSRHVFAAREALERSPTSRGQRLHQPASTTASRELTHGALPRPGSRSTPAPARASWGSPERLPRGTPASQRESAAQASARSSIPRPGARTTVISNREGSGAGSGRHHRRPDEKRAVTLPREGHGRRPLDLLAQFRGLEASSLTSVALAKKALGQALVLRVHVSRLRDLAVPHSPLRQSGSFRRAWPKPSLRLSHGIRVCGEPGPDRGRNGASGRPGRGSTRSWALRTQAWEPPAQRECAPCASRRVRYSAHASRLSIPKIVRSRRSLPRSTLPRWVRGRASTNMTSRGCL